MWLTPDTGFVFPSEYRVSAQELRTALARGKVRVPELAGGGTRGITKSAVVMHPKFVDVGTRLTPRDSGHPGITKGFR